ncbi:MiAMP1 family antimicrobial peptide [Streptomyces scopuliridis]|uniref:MiAMP1 family antimicrobial peptide n=1 Tax=Streptomyces scopuliridis TaxID=452529 RepID=A0ACD4ZKZ7_9ACTN|nr:MiAMP1 family antimicrobial peptide [Streptomyces scopuliridis]WSB98481.1 MiAMP1 family antimicrobial peptide [Streptomyces scopuliridis]WSC07817.1 MiAMP1 family antimicrobial peptide [Streptomyces scopuliridis]
MRNRRNRRTLRSTVTATAVAGVLALGAGSAVASGFLSWEGPQNTGRAKELTRCGCSNIDPNFRAAYRFTYTGQTAAMYNQPDCAGTSHYTFRGNSESVQPFGWRSIFIHC